ncbi:unnamed protein product [Echinostoma caproni]|uniref:Integrase_H2C2 domain-containing protein n=1 Tax=Echinostoma caproni TaxID=27848 RepID=A0A183A466_9TREM|nr:unnamed protein product [Echinostoma caproni]
MKITSCWSVSNLKFAYENVKAMINVSMMTLVMVRTIKGILQACMKRHNADLWDELLPGCMLAYRDADCTSTGMTPAYLTFEIHLPIDVTTPVAPAEEVSTSQFAQQLRQKLHIAFESANRVHQMAHLQQKQQYDRSVLGSSYAKGDKIWLHRPKPPVGACAKFHRPWQGPYEIVFIRSPMVYVIRGISSSTADVLTAHYNQLKTAGHHDLPNHRS